MDPVELRKRAELVRATETQIADLETEQRRLADRNLEINMSLSDLHMARRDARDATLREALGEPDPQPKPDAPEASMDAVTP